MITVEESFPSRSDRYLAAQDVLWTQFNQVNFYVEDKDQERFYFTILKKIFPNIIFERIFPLNGKPSIIKEANESLTNNKKVFLLDLDFDEILQRKSNLPNLFYLRKYSIENYLLEEDAIHEIIRESKPKIRDSEIENKFNLNSVISEHKNILAELASSFLIIQKHGLGLKYLKINPPGDIDSNQTPICFRSTCYSVYQNSLELALADKDNRLKLTAQKKSTIKYFKTERQIIDNAPGKYIINIIKFALERAFSLTSMPIESFTYRLAKNCTLNQLSFLKDDILAFIR